MFICLYSTCIIVNVTYMVTWFLFIIGRNLLNVLSICIINYTSIHRDAYLFADFSYSKLFKRFLNVMIFLCCIKFYRNVKNLPPKLQQIQIRTKNHSSDMDYVTLVVLGWWRLEHPILAMIAKVATV